MNAKIIIIIKEIFQTWSKLTLMGQCFISARLWQSYQDHKHGCCGTSHAIFGSRNSAPAGKGQNAFFLSTVFCQASTAVLALYPNFPCWGSEKALLHPSAFQAMSWDVPLTESHLSSLCPLSYYCHSAANFCSYFSGLPKLLFSSVYLSLF